MTLLAASNPRVRGRAARPLTGGTDQQDTLRNASEEFQSKTPQDMRSETISKRECQRQNWSEVRNGCPLSFFHFRFDERKLVLAHLGSFASDLLLSLHGKRPPLGVKKMPP